MQDFTKKFNNYSKKIESICKYKMIMFMIMLNSFQNSCQKNNKDVIKQPKKKPLEKNKNEIENQKNEKNKLMEKLFFSPFVSNHKGVPPLT